ncbi:hypothetical protein [Lysobacter sp. yr284]|uniref:hypothetical protein n=1 Tax=Lysobacter sp. yr284 TaxID=1761791 RepID=UPI001113C074|nr:hypothetical protein [Lysobacter sp. yr284]
MKKLIGGLDTSPVETFDVSVPISFAGLDVPTRHTADLALCANASPKKFDTVSVRSTRTDADRLWAAATPGQTLTGGILFK